MMAAGQGIGPQFGVAAGLGVPIGAYHADANAYGKGFDIGWQGMALAAFKVPGWRVGFRVDGTYGVNSANATLNGSNGQSTEEKSKVLGANLDLSYSFPSRSRLDPYLLGGIGVYHTTISITGGRFLPADTAETTVAWNVGAGVLYSARGVTFFLEARYVDVAGGLGFSCPLATSCARQPGPRTTFLPIMAGIRFGER
jgi:opacity protein-like surface antigen